MQDYLTIIGVIDLRSRGHSYEEVRRRYGLGVSTISLLGRRFIESGRTLEQLRRMEPQEVVDLFYPPESRRRKRCAPPDFVAIHRRMVEMGRNADLALLWLEYKEKDPDGYQLSQFYKLYGDYLRETHQAGDSTMPVEHVPGERMFIDWVGDQPELLLDPATGELGRVHLYTTTMAFSSKVFAEAFADEKLPSYLKGTADAVAFYGALPEYFVPDNPKVAITRNTRDAPVLSSAFEDLEEFYGVVVLPAPPRKPKGKPTVERHVLYLERHLVERLKEGTYTTLGQVNDAISAVVAEINARPFQRGYDIRGSRDEAFEKYDRPQMRPLPNGSFSICDYRYVAHVPDNYHLVYDGHYYSLPYTRLGKPAMLKATATEVRICDENNQLICSHPRSYRTFPLYITDDDHMPPDHRFSKELDEHDGGYYRRWASAIGENTATLIDRVIRSYRHEEQSYRSCAGILHMCKGIPNGIVEQVARKCLEAGACRYTYFKRALSQARGPHDLSPEGTGHLPEHDNIRGKDCYR